MKKGFTLIELLVVISIISLLASVVFASLQSAKLSANDARRQSDIRSIQIALEGYYSENGTYPIRSWVYSYSESPWDSLGSDLGVDLPVDPVNESTNPRSGGSSYAYYSLQSQTGCANGQAYLLVYHVESRIIDPSENIGINKCDGGTRKYGNNSITVGNSF